MTYGARNRATTATTTCAIANTASAIVAHAITLVQVVSCLVLASVAALLRSIALVSDVSSIATRSAARSVTAAVSRALATASRGASFSRCCGFTALAYSVRCSSVTLRAESARGTGFGGEGGVFAFIRRIVAEALGSSAAQWKTVCTGRTGRKMNLSNPTFEVPRYLRIVDALSAREFVSVRAELVASAKGSEFEELIVGVGEA